MRLFTPFLILFALVVSGGTARGQMDDFAWGDFSRAANSNNGKLSGTRFLMEMVTTPFHFYHPSWMEGTVTTAEGETYDGLRLRYDALHDELVAFNDRVNGLYVVDKYRVASFTVTGNDGMTSQFRKFSPEGSQEKEKYYEVLYEGSVTLLCSHRIVERQTSLYRNKYGRLDNRSFEPGMLFFLVGGDSRLLPVFPSRRSLISLFPEQKREVRRFFRKQTSFDYSEMMIPIWISKLDKEGFFNGGR